MIHLRKSLFFHKNGNRTTGTMLAIITYNKPHRKTQDVLSKLLIHGIKPTVITIPFKERVTHNPLYQHRPQECENIDVAVMCDNLGLKLINTEDPSLHYNDFDMLLIAGAGIIEPSDKVINIHPGYLPDVRGLDAFKWAIYKGLPIGVTAHKITKDIDKGEILIRTEIKPMPTDTFYSLAMKVYETEIKMFVECATHQFKAESLSKKAYENIYTEATMVHKRMPHYIEVAMMQKWQKYEQIQRI